MRFPPVFIERLRSHFLISEVIGRRMPIKKHGREFMGLCPFHNEKTPSFTINDEKGFYHCFGCGAHGDTIEFVRKFERLSYVETMELLAREAGIPIPQASEYDVKKAAAEKTLHDVTEAACQWFEKQLSAPHGIMAMDYVEKRGLKPETIRQFRIGYAPEDRTPLHQHLNSLGFSQSLQAEAGLIIQPEQGGIYDRFRGRVIFPIRNARGIVIAFGGRLLANNPNNKLPKYLNSPETPLFKKGELLYNLDLAKKPARDDNIIVVMEGYMDVVSTAQSGVNYAVATLGTAVTQEHLRLLWQLAKEPVMCLDGDAAGKRAMMRAAEVALPLLKPGYSLRFAVLPNGEDPDTFVQKYGKSNFEKILMNSRRLSQVLWETAQSEYKTDLPEGRAALENALKQTSDKIADQTVRAHYASYFRKLLWAKSPTQQKPVQERSKHVVHMAMQEHSGAIAILVERMLAFLLQFPQLLHKSQVEEMLSHLDIASARMNTLRDLFLAAAHGQADIDDPEKFAAFMHAQFHGEMPTANLKLPYKEALSVDDALLLWNEMAAAYQVAHLELEYKTLREQIGHAVDEESNGRLVELQQAIRKAQTQRNFARAETDVA